MSRTNENYQGEVEKREVSPLILVRITGIEDEEGVLNNVYLTDWPQDGQFVDENGDTQTYLSCGLSFQPISVSNDTEIDGGSLKIDNTTREMGKLVLTHSLKKAKVQIIRALFDHLDNDLYSLTIFRGFLRQYRVSESDLELTLVSMFNLMQKGPKRLHWNYCPWGFKGPECSYAGGDISCDHTLTDCKAKGNEVNFGGFPYLPAGKDVREPLE